MDLNRFSVTGEEERVASLKLQKGRLINLRWYYISLLVIIAAISSIAARQPLGMAIHYVIIGLVALTCNTALLLAKKIPTKLRGTVVLLVLQLVLDLGVATYVTYDQGGLSARTSILFALPIVAAGILFTRGIVYLTAILAGTGYIMSIVLCSVNHGTPLVMSEALVPITFYPLFFIILGQLVVYLMSINTNETREKAYDAYLALMMHQLKRPVSTVNAIIDQLENGPPLSLQKNKEYLFMLKTENLSLNDLLNNLFEASTNPYVVADSSVVDLSGLIQQLAYRNAEIHSRNEDLRLMIDDMSLTVTGDSSKLTIALVNILNNAFEYSTAGTPVTVTAREAGANVMIVVEDRGGGISKAGERELFHKFNIAASPWRSSSGLGLGLYVAKKIVEAHHGTLHIVSDSSGTKVIIILKRGNTHE